MFDHEKLVVYQHALEFVNFAGAMIENSEQKVILTLRHSHR